MRNYIITGMILTLLIGACTSKKLDINVEKTNIQASYERYRKAMEEEDLKAIMSCFLNEKDVVCLFSDGTPAVGLTAIESMYKAWFQEVDSIRITISNMVIRIHPQGCAAWISFVEEGREVTEQERSHWRGMRLTIGMEKHDSEWFIVQLHASAPWNHPDFVIEPRK